MKEVRKIKHICFISAGLAGGGMEKSLTNIANYAALQGHRVTIFNLFTTEVFFDLHPSIKVIWPSIDRQKYHRLVYALKLLPYIRRGLRELNPDTVLSFGEWFNGYVLLATRFSGTPVFITDRMGPLLDIGPLLETARKILYKYADGIIAQTKVSAEILYNKTGATKIKIIPNALSPVDTETSLKKNQIVTVGRLSREKGHVTLLEAFAKIKNKDWTLHIVGDGKEKQNLMKQCKDLCIESRVVFYGHLKDFGKILGESDIFVLPSFYEGFPNALIEAMSVPLASVSSNCVAGPADIIRHEHNGMLYEPGNIEELTIILNNLIGNTDLRQSLSNEAIKIRETLEFKKIAQQYLDFILCK